MEHMNKVYIEVEKVVEKISQEAGLKKSPKVYILDHEDPNSFVFGRWKSDARLVLSRGLIENLNSMELEGVIAHEIAHILNKDIWLISWAQLLFDSLKYWFVLFSSLGFAIVYIGRSAAPTFLELEFLEFFQIVPLYFVFLVIFPWIVLSSTSRTRELFADARAALMGKRDCLIQALNRISALKGEAKIKSRLKSPRFLSITPSKLVNPSRSIIVKYLFDSHPPDRTRINALYEDKFVLTERSLRLPTFTTAVYIGIVSFYFGIIAGNIYGALVGIRHVSSVGSILTFGALKDIGFVPAVSPIIAVLLNFWTWRHSINPHLGFMSMLNRILLSMITVDLLFNLIFMIPKTVLLVIYEEREFFKVVALTFSFILVSLYVDKWVKSIFNRFRNLKSSIHLKQMCDLC
jgi:heat shock protein HtpX